MSSISTYELSCITELPVLGEAGFESWFTMWRIVTTLVTVSIASSWCNAQKIRRLLLFFSHWLSGFLFQVSEVISGTMVYVCWADKRQLPYIYVLKFIEQTGTNMLAITNLAICVNLALIVSSHHNMTRVTTVSTPRLMMVLTLISLGATAALVPFWDGFILTRTLFWPYSTDPAELVWVASGYYFLELITGLSMSVIVGLLLVFRMPELVQCWRLHKRIRFYFMLTAVAVLASVGQGICGALFIISEYTMHSLNSVSWSVRHVHIALDTMVLYSVLGVSAREMDERAGGDCSGEVEISGSNVPKRYRTSGRWQSRRASQRVASSSTGADSAHDEDMTV